MIGGGEWESMIPSKQGTQGCVGRYFPKSCASETEWIHRSLAASICTFRIEHLGLRLFLLTSFKLNISKIANTRENMDEVILKETCPMENGVRIVMTLNMTTSISYVQFINREPFPSICGPHKCNPILKNASVDKIPPTEKNHIESNICHPQSPGPPFT
jgi:hypothetical protein